MTPSTMFMDTAAYKAHGYSSAEIRALRKPTSNLRLNDKGFAIVAVLNDHGIKPFDSHWLPALVSFAPWSVEPKTLEAFCIAREAVEMMPPKERRAATRRGKALTVGIVRYPVPGYEWALLRE